MTATQTLASSNRATPHINTRSAAACPLIARTLMKAPTAPQSSKRSASASSATGEPHARHANQAAVSAPSPSSFQSGWLLPRRHHAGSAASTESPSAIIAGPQLHGRVCGPINTAKTSDRTRKSEETTGMME